MFTCALAENIEYVISFIDPKKRVLREVKKEQFNAEDFDVINDYIHKRGATLLTSTQEDGELCFRDPSNVAQNDIVKRDIAYQIKRIRAKKRLQNDFTSRNTHTDPGPDDFMEDEFMSEQ